jgi:hypothetical protein
MYAISFDPQPTMKVNIHNQCSHFKLTNQVSFSTSETLNEYFAWEVEAGTMLSVDLEPPLSVFEGVLAYTLKREDVESIVQFVSTHIQLFIV